MTKISVIIPCFNQGHFIDEAVDSVMSQTFQDFEIIIINDGSTDDFTNDKIKSYNKPKTKVITTENKGLASARNTGFKVASGEFIQFLDADDMISSLKFEEQLRTFDQNPGIEVCYTNYKIFDNDKVDFLKLPDKKFLSVEPLNDFLFRVGRGLSIPIHCALFKKSIWNSKAPFNEELRAREDWLMWCDLSVRNIRFYFLDREYAIYRFHENNMSNNHNDMNFTFLLAAYYIMEIIPERMKKEFLRETIIYIIKCLEINLYPDLVNEISDLKKRFLEMDKTIDYKIGHLLMKPYRFLKTKLFGKNYL